MEAESLLARCDRRGAARVCVQRATTLDRWKQGPTGLAQIDSDLALEPALPRTDGADAVTRFEFHCRLTPAIHEAPVCIVAEFLDQYRAALALTRAGADRAAHLRKLAAAAAAPAGLGVS
jgi:hypothetical protein